MPVKRNALRRRPVRKMEEDAFYDVNDFMEDNDFETDRFNDIEQEDDINEPMDETDLFEENGAAKPMADDKLKLECLKIAINVSKLANRKDVITVADELFKYVKGGSI